jgi:hypothetical protein
VLSTSAEGICALVLNRRTQLGQVLDEMSDAIYPDVRFDFTDAGLQPGSENAGKNRIAEKVI